MAVFTYEAKDPESKQAYAKAHFDCGFVSPITNANASRLLSIIEADYPPQSQDDVKANGIITGLLSITRTVEFEGDIERSDELSALRRFWGWMWDNALIRGDSLFHNDKHLINVAFVMDEAILRQIYGLFQSMVSSDIQYQWGLYYLQASNQYPAKRTLLPDSMLTDAEKSNPDFLAGKSPTVRRSGNGRKPKRTTTKNRT